MKANHNLQTPWRVCNLVVVNISKSKNESKSQLLAFKFFYPVCCGKYK